jgi:hypothetical protein
MSTSPNPISSEIAADKTLTLDFFAYDLNEPDVVALLEQIGDALRAIIAWADRHLGADRTLSTLHEALGYLARPASSAPRFKNRLDFCRKGRIAMGADRWTWPPGETLRARLAMCGALGCASLRRREPTEPKRCRPFP